MNTENNEMLNKKIAIGFVIYFPEESIIDKIKLVEESGFMFYIFDNSPKISLVRDFCKKLKNCKYITCGKNVGLGFGISSICAQAYYDSFSAFLFFDQDTCFNIDTLNFIQDFYKSHFHLESSYSAIVFNSKEIHQNSSENKYELKDVLMVINSGSLFFLKNLEALNWHNTNYFVECVDYEFCLNSNNNNFKIAECSKTPGFDHKTKQPDKKYKIFGKEKFLRKYSRKRLFDYLFASIKLILKSIKTRNIRFTKAYIRSFVIYLYFQSIIRIIKIFK